MTQWVESPEGGRERGPRGLGRAWFEVLVRPRRFFSNGVAPADQAPGLAFAVSVAFVHVASRLVFAPESLPRVADSAAISAVFVLGVACLLVTPLLLHLAAALGTLGLLPLVRDRAGVSETVQVIAYATAPCVFAAIPVPIIQLLAVGYGVVLLVVGIAVVHETSPLRAAGGAALPAVVVFGFAFGGFGAAEAVIGVEFVEDPRDR